MKIFIGWPYDAVWVDDYVIPFVQSYGVTVTTGKELQGKVITDGVKERIEEADAVLFVTTRREGPDGKGNYTTSDWVLDEIKHANSIGKEFIIEVREEGVDYANKIHAERQYIPCDPNNLVKCFVELGRAIGQWRGLSLKLKVSPLGDASDKQAFVVGLRRRTGYECIYRIRQQGKVVHQSTRTVEIIPEGQDFFIYTDELPTDYFRLPDVYLEVEIDIAGMQWTAYGIRLNNPVEVILETINSVQKRRLGAE
jgi:hypothetical protein